MSEKHSPGPWTLQRSLDEGRERVYVRAAWGEERNQPGAGGIVCLVFAAGELREADARLIAAAPELLRLLRDAVDTLGCWDLEDALVAEAGALIDSIDPPRPAPEVEFHDEDGEI